MDTRDFDRFVPTPKANKLALAKIKEQWREEKENAATKSQSWWQRKIIGPSLVHVDLVSDCGFDFDAYVLKNTELKIPNFTIEAKRQWKSARRGKWFPAIVPTIESPADFFNWLFLRAIVNFQTSRFAYCVVCGKWSLKRIAGNRSTAVVKKIVECQENKNLPRANFLGKLPAWSAVCSRQCNIVFQRVMRGKTPRRLEHFAIRKVWA